MPRGTNQLCLDRHRFLKKDWEEFQILYSILPVERQWNIHAYYQPMKDSSRT